MKRRRRGGEHIEQVALMRWVDWHKQAHPELKLMYAIPNMGKRHINFAIKMKAEGLKSGVPDLCLPVPRNGKHGLYIEMKTAKGRVEPTQAEWIIELNRQGYDALVCRGWQMAALTIGTYLGMPQNALEGIQP